MKKAYLCATLVAGVVLSLILASCGLDEGLFAGEDDGVIRAGFISGCEYQGDQVTVLVDGASAGTVTGNSVVEKSVSTGHHRVSMVMPDGTYTYPEVTVDVEAQKTTTQTFRCPLAVVRVSVASSCFGKTSLIDIALDGSVLGRVEPGGLQVTVAVARGSHTIHASGLGGYSWDVSKTLAWVEDWTQSLTCS